MPTNLFSFFNGLMLYSSFLLTTDKFFISYINLYLSGVLFLFALDASFARYISRTQAGPYKKIRAFVLYPVFYVEFCIKRRKNLKASMEKAKNMSGKDLANEMRKAADLVDKIDSKIEERKGKESK